MIRRQLGLSISLCGINRQPHFGRDLEFLDYVPSGKDRKLPVVLSRSEIARLLPEFSGLKRLMFLIMYGSGLRHGECLRLRIKDVCLDTRQIIVRNGKGEKDRITVLPNAIRGSFEEQSELVRRRHKRDLENGFGTVYLHVMNKPGLAVVSPVDRLDDKPENDAEDAGSSG